LYTHYLAQSSELFSDIMTMCYINLFLTYLLLCVCGAL